MSTNGMIEYRTYEATLPGFDGAEATFIVTADRQVYLPVRQMCRILGLAHQPQIEALRSDEKSASSLLPFTIRTPGGMQETLCIRKRECAWWVVHVNPKRVKPEIRDRLEDLQRAVIEVADRLVFGDLSSVLEGNASKALPAPWGEFHFPCQRCGAPHVVLIADGTVQVRIDPGQR